MEIRLGSQRHGQPHTLGTVPVQYTPTGYIAKPLGFAAYQALCIDSTDAPHDLPIISQYKSVVGLLNSPVLPESIGPIIGGACVTQVFVKKSAKIQEIAVLDGFNCWLAHFFRLSTVIINEQNNIKWQ
jgi:hypothetical protein